MAITSFLTNVLNNYLLARTLSVSGVQARVRIRNVPNSPFVWKVTGTRPVLSGGRCGKESQGFFKIAAYEVALSGCLSLRETVSEQILPVTSHHAQRRISVRQRSAIRKGFAVLPRAEEISVK